MTKGDNYGKSHTVFWLHVEYWDVIFITSHFGILLINCCCQSVILFFISYIKKLHYHLQSIYPLAQTILQFPLAYWKKYSVLKWRNEYYYKLFANSVIRYSYFCRSAFTSHKIDSLAGCVLTRPDGTNITLNGQDVFEGLGEISDNEPPRILATYTTVDVSSITQGMA